MHLSHRQKVILSTVLVLLFVALLLGFAEGAIRIRQWVKYGHFGRLDSIYTVDQKTGLRVPVTNTSTRTININPLGFRGPPLDQPKPTGRLRLVFLGASTTFCAEVSSDEMTWPHLVTEELQAAIPGVTFDYVNGAVPGYTVHSSLKNLRERIAPLEPDVIVIYHATNDLSQETRLLAEKQGIYQAGQADEMSWLAEYSLLWYLAEKNLRLMVVRSDTEALQQRLAFFPSQLGERFRSDLTELVMEARKVSPVVALVSFSHQIRAGQSPGEQLEAAGSALYYMPFMTPDGLLAAFARYNEIIAEVAQEEGVFMIGGESLIPGDNEHFNDSVHFKDAGSRVMARRVSEALLRFPGFQDLVSASRSSNE
jgi:lysophospholipase L1-like esterase